MPTFPPKFPVKPGPRADFDPMEFRDVILQKGQDVVWQMCALCPCGQNTEDVSKLFDYSTVLGQKAVTGEPRAICPVCNGVGWYWHSPQTIRVLIQDMSLAPRRFGVESEYARGRAQITFLPENKPALGDRVELLYSVHRVNEMTRRPSAAKVQALRFPIRSQDLQTATGVQTVRVIQLQRAVSNVTSGADFLTEGVDFIVNANGSLDWTLGDITGKAPAPGHAFTITYFAHPRYVVEDVPFAIRDTNTQKKTPTPISEQLPINTRAWQEYRGIGVNQGYG